jgi:hypothetical protein
MPEITIQGTPIEFPDSGASPNWAEATIQFAEAVEDALAVAVGTGDITPTSITLDSFNGVTDQSITGLSFSTSTIRAAFISYSIYRTTSAADAAEAGQLIVLFNDNNGVGEKWEILREYSGDGQTTFSITDAGQVQFSNTALAGTGHAGKLRFMAKALTQS